MIFNFGPLILKWTIRFNAGSIEPVTDFDTVTASIKAQTDDDGFLYPPPHHDVVAYQGARQIVEETPRASRPARVFPLGPTHALDLPGITMEEPHRESHAFILHLLGYLFGIRLQFSDWYFDGRVPTRLYFTHNTDVSHATCESFLSHCYGVWSGLGATEKSLVINTLAMHCRAPSYRWDWEQFMMEYTVTDTCWKLANSQLGLPAKTAHEKRITVMCEKLGVRYQGDAGAHIEKIVTLRRDLLHEATWDGSQPCMATGEGIHQVYNLRRLNQRLIPALLQYTTPYIGTPWWVLDTFPFDKT